MTRYPMANKVKIPRPYVPAVATDIRKTIKAEKRRLAQQAVPAVATDIRKTIKAEQRRLAQQEARMIHAVMEG